MQLTLCDVLCTLFFVSPGQHRYKLFYDAIGAKRHADAEKTNSTAKEKKRSD